MKTASYRGGGEYRGQNDEKYHAGCIELRKMLRLCQGLTG